VISSAVAQTETVGCSGINDTTTITTRSTRVVGFAQQNCQPNCQIKIPRQQGVCQLRVDFLNFTVGAAQSDGTCGDDTVSIHGAVNLASGLTLCGQAKNQHLYLHYGDGDSCSITITTHLETLGSLYDLEITMIDCDSADKAPTGCTQYFKSPAGQVQSFNYPAQQLNDQRYSVCVGGDGPSITWKPCGKANESFFITGDPYSLVGSIQGDNCQTDYVLIPPSSILCGSAFSDSIISIATPFIMFVNFDHTEYPDIPPINPDTGCPLGYTCAADYLPCQGGDTCYGPPFLADLIDDSNSGFCLKYSIL